MHLGGLLSTQEARVALGDSYASFVLSNLPRASITPWLHAACYPFLNFKPYFITSIMMPVSNSWLKKLVVTFSLFIAAVVLHTLNTSSFCTSHNQEVSTKENLPFQSTRSATQLVQVDEQLMIFITSAPFYTSRKLAIRQTWLVKKSI